MDRIPFPASWTVRQARDAYLAENGFTVAAYDDAWTEASFLGIRFKVPNTARHRWAIMLHDLHHVVTGYGTDLIGEGEVSIWELRRGLGSLGTYVGAIVLGGAMMGFVMSPRRGLAAYRVSGGGRSLFDPNTDYDALLDLTVGELRQMLRVEENGVAGEPRRLHAYAPAS